MADLRKRGIVTKKRLLKSGETVGGIPFTRGPLAHLLRNRFYIGEVVFKGETLPGEQPAILDRALFDAVQAKLDGQLSNYQQSRTSSEAILVGRIFDDRGQRMTPTHTRKGAVEVSLLRLLSLGAGPARTGRQHQPHTGTRDRGDRQRSQSAIISAYWQISTIRTWSRTMSPA